VRVPSNSVYLLQIGMPVPRHHQPSEWADKTALNKLVNTGLCDDANICSPAGRELLTPNTCTCEGSCTMAKKLVFSGFVLGFIVLTSSQSLIRRLTLWSDATR
jgi:hypothetical protein